MINRSFSFKKALQPTFGSRDDIQVWLKTKNKKTYFFKKTHRLHELNTPRFSYQFSFSQKIKHRILGLIESGCIICCDVRKPS